MAHLGANAFCKVQQTADGWDVTLFNTSSVHVIEKKKTMIVLNDAERDRIAIEELISAGTRTKVESSDREEPETLPGKIERKSFSTQFKKSGAVLNPLKKTNAFKVAKKAGL